MNNTALTPEKLHYYAAHEDIESVERCLASGIEVDTRDISGYTPLMKAVKNVHLAVAKVLKASGASLQARNRNHPVMLSCVVNDRSKEATEKSLKQFLKWGINLIGDVEKQESQALLGPAMVKRLQNYSNELDNQVKSFAGNGMLDASLIEDIKFFRISAKYFRVIYRWVLKGNIPLDENGKLVIKTDVNGKTVVEGLPKEKGCYAGFLPLVVFYRNLVNGLRDGNYNLSDKETIQKVELSYDIIFLIIKVIYKKNSQESSVSME